jgi:hypothetical protein
MLQAKALASPTGDADAAPNGGHWGIVGRGIFFRTESPISALEVEDYHSPRRSVLQAV